MRHPLIALPVSLVLAVGLAACGGGTLTKDEYIRQADAICKKVNAEGERLPDPKGIGDLGALVDEAKPQLEDEVKQLRDLKAPEEIRALAEGAFDLLDEQASNLGRLKAAAEANDEAKVQDLLTNTGTLSTKASAQARRIGLKVCGSGG